MQYTSIHDGWLKREGGTVSVLYNARKPGGTKWQPCRYAITVDPATLKVTDIRLIAQR